MSKLGDLSALIEDLIDCGETLTKTARSLYRFYTNTNEEPEAAAPLTASPEPAAIPAPAPDPPKTYTKEEVRGILAKKANEQEGRYKNEVKALVQKYANGGTLTNVDPKNYPDLIKEVEAMKDG